MSTLSTSLRTPLAEPADRPTDWQATEIRRVVIRLVDGDVVPVGTAPNRDGAMVLAHSVIDELERPSGEWPLVADRLLRPDAIVSVDVLVS